MPVWGKEKENKYSLGYVISGQGLSIRSMVPMYANDETAGALDVPVFACDNAKCQPPTGLAQTCQVRHYATRLLLR